METFNILNSTNVGAFLLDMESDASGVYHAKFDCWQAIAGYNDLYDKVFQEATSAEPIKLDFNCNGEDLILWAWKGDYINLGAGAELGIYTKYDSVPVDHWFVDKDLALPMTLTLIDKDGNIIVDNYAPEEKQWWITGFNPDFMDMLADDLTAIYTIDFSDNIDMFEAFYQKHQYSVYCTFDMDNYIVTIKF